MDALLQSLIKLTRLEKKEVDPVLRFFAPVNISAKAILLEPGSISHTVWFIGQGILRAYSVVQENKRSGITEFGEQSIRETTNWIVSEGGFLTDVRSFISVACYLLY